MELSSQIARVLETGISKNCILKYALPRSRTKKELSPQIGGTLLTNLRRHIASNLRYSRDCRETFVRLSHDVRQNIA